MTKKKEESSITDQLSAKFRFSDIEFIVVNAYDFSTRNGYQIKCFVIPYIKKESGEERMDDVFGVDNWKNDFQMPGPNNLIKYKLIYRVPGSDEWHEKYEGSSLDTRERGQFSQTAFESALAFAEKRALAKLGVGRYLKLCPQIEVRTSETWVEGWERYSFRSRVHKGQDNKPKYVNIYWEPPILPKEYLHEDDYHLLEQVVDDNPSEKQSPQPKKQASQPKAADKKQWGVIESYFEAFDLEDQNLWESYLYNTTTNEEDGSVSHHRKKISSAYADRIIGKLEKAYGPLENGKPVEYDPKAPLPNTEDKEKK